MIKGMRREVLFFLAACIFGAVLCCYRAEAGEYTEFDLIGDAESPVGEDVTDIPVKKGILMLENPCEEGDLEITDSAGTFVMEWDYSDWAGVLGEVCTIRVTPHAGYAVDAVLIDGEPLEPGEDGTYSLLLEKEMSELSVKYTASDAMPDSDGEMAGDTENLRNENVSGSDPATPSGNFDRTVSGDISYDIVVSYEDEESEEPAIQAASVIEGDESTLPERPVVISDEETALAASVPDSANDSGREEIPVPMPEEESSEEVSSEEAKLPASGDETKVPEMELEEETSTDVAMKLEEKSSERPAHPVYAGMAAVPELREPADVAWDWKLLGVLLAGAALSMLFTCAVKRR